MREFYFNLLNNLYILTGLKQMDKLNELEDPKKEVNALLDVLCDATNQFSHIPFEAQQKIINEKIITDTEFIGFNKKIIFKWLMPVSGHYIKPEKEVVPEDYTVLEGEQRAEKIKQWQIAILGIGAPKSSGVAETIRSSFPEVPNVTSKYTPPSLEENIKRDLHLQYIRENYDARTAEKKEGWLSEKDWLELNS